MNIARVQSYWISFARKRRKKPQNNLTLRKKNERDIYAYANSCDVCLRSAGTRRLKTSALTPAVAVVNTYVNAAFIFLFIFFKFITRTIWFILLFFSNVFFFWGSLSFSLCANGNSSWNFFTFERETCGITIIRPSSRRRAHCILTRVAQIFRSNTHFGALGGTCSKTNGRRRCDNFDIFHFLPVSCNRNHGSRVFRTRATSQNKNRISRHRGGENVEKRLFAVYKQTVFQTSFLRNRLQPRYTQSSCPLLDFRNIRWKENASIFRNDEVLLPSGLTPHCARKPVGGLFFFKREKRRR